MLFGLPTMPMPSMSKSYQSYARSCRLMALLKACMQLQPFCRQHRSRPQLQAAQLTEHQASPVAASAWERQLGRQSPHFLRGLISTRTA